MLEKIKDQEIITRIDAEKKYPTKYFIMIITDIVDQGDNDLGYVLYTADTKKELKKAPREELMDKKVAFKEGWSVEPYPTIGNVVYHG